MTVPIKWIIRNLFYSLMVFLIIRNVQIYYEYQASIGAFWDLSDRASSLPVKTQYLDQFVKALQSTRLADYDATIFKTPDSGREQNMNALLSLQTRMHEIQGMNPTSFEYQQAIAQITGQEQGEADILTDTLRGLWTLQHHPWFWDWHQIVVWILVIVAYVAFEVLIRSLLEIP